MKIEHMPKYITATECTKWLHDHNMVESPYGLKENKSKYCDQYKITKREEFSSEIIEQMGSFKDGLLVFMDWNFYHPEDWKYYKPYELPFIEMVHTTTSKQNPSFDKGSGFLYADDQRIELISHIKLSIELGWSVYLYPDSATTTLFFWEGELMDVWSDSKIIFSNLKKLLG